MGPFAVAIPVFAFLAIATVAGIVGDYKKRRAALEPLRAAIERGQTLDPSVIERLMAPEPRDDRLNTVHLRVGGVITIASGIGVAIFSLFLGVFAPLAKLPLLGLGCVAICVGLGLIVAARVAERHQQTAVAHAD
jgi:hypothetical protein